MKTIDLDELATVCGGIEFPTPEEKSCAAMKGFGSLPSDTNCPEWAQKVREDRRNAIRRSLG